MKSPPPRSAAIVTIFNAQNMSGVGRADIAHWLRKVARDLLENADLYASRFTARYLYRKELDLTK